MATTADETWVKIGHHGHYIVSSRGRVRRAQVGAPILKGFVDRYGYLTVLLSADGVSRRFKMHRLVCEAFHGPSPEGCEVAHLDGNRLNNLADSLAWVTPSVNNQHKRQHGTHQAGEAHPRVKLTAEQVKQIRASDASSRALAREFGVGQSQIVRIKNGLRWPEGIAQVSAIAQSPDGDFQ